MNVCAIIECGGVIRRIDIEIKTSLSFRFFNR
jgi:hypothetical protein